MGGMAPAPEKVWKVIGQQELGYTHTYATSKQDRVAIIIYFMTEQNDRRIEITCSEKDKAWVIDNIPEVHAWVKGGRFPKEFQPEDSLGEMLNRLIDARLTGKTESK